MEVLPPLSQSATETMDCPRSYIEQFINGKHGTASVESERGNEVHRVMAAYITHCADERVAVDWPAFDRIARAVGPLAGKILQVQRDSYRVDWQHLFGAEVTLALNEELQPCIATYERGRSGELIADYMPGPAAHIGTLDAIYLNDITGIIEDFKSHPQPFEPDTYQSLLYPLMLFKHLPKLRRVTFRLRFVRYQNNTREVTWERTDIPEMGARLRQSRERQRGLHENPDAAMALPCKVCTYCPMARDLTCPIADWNEYLTLSVSDRLRAVEWYARMAKLHKPILKQYVEANGPGSVSYRDGKGATYSFEPVDTPQTTYPLDNTSIQVLRDYREATGEDLLNGRLNISSTKLKPLLKAKKRTALREVFEESIIVTATKPKWGTRRSDADPELEQYEEDEDSGE